MTTLTQTLYMSQSPMSMDSGGDRFVIGIEVGGMFIYDPYKSECGRFEVDPRQSYGLTAEQALEIKYLNDMIDSATENAINAGCETIQKALGVINGDAA